MDRRSTNQPKKTKTISKSRKNRLDMCPNIPKMLLSVRYNKRENNKIVMLGPNKGFRKSVIARVRNNGSLFQSNVCNFRRDLAAMHNSEVSPRRELALISNFNFVFRCSWSKPQWLHTTTFHTTPSSNHNSSCCKQSLGSSIDASCVYKEHIYSFIH